MIRSVPLPARTGRRTSTTALALLSASCLLLGTAASADAAPKVYEESFVQVTVRGQATATDVDGCDVAEIFVDASEHFVTYQQVCVATGAGLYGSSDPITFDVSGDGTTAHVVAEIELYSDATGGPAGVLLLDNTWTASGKAARVKGHYTDHEPGGTRVVFRQKGLRSPATVTGTVPLDHGTIERSTTTVVVRDRA